MTKKVIIAPKSLISSKLLAATILSIDASVHVINTKKEKPINDPPIIALKDIILYKKDEYKNHQPKKDKITRPFWDKTRNKY